MASAAMTKRMVCCLSAWIDMQWVGIAYRYRRTPVRASGHMRGALGAEPAVFRPTPYSAAPAFIWSLGLTSFERL